MRSMEKQVVLVVDDVPDNIDVLVNILSDEYSVKAATDGATAIRIAGSSNPPDLILLDVIMPRMDGFETCRLLKQDPRTKHIPVIFVTAKSDTAHETQGFETGAIDYISKPVSPPIVRARVKTHLALYDQNRELEERVRERTTELQETRLEIIRRLGRAAEFKDNETGLHVIRMSSYAREIALEYGVSNEEADLILLTSPMHDIGKIGIPDSILLKPGPLDDEEWKFMRRHPKIGGDIIGDHPSNLLQQAAVCAFTHHEKWDGGGYPRGLSGEEIPLIGRIVAIADVFDALTTERPYKRAWPKERAMKVIEEDAGTHFDPDLVGAFLKRRKAIEEIGETYKET
jgi:putative two-component system response regulator